MKDFAAAVAMLDAKADARLGDSLFYDASGLPAADPVKGFIFDPAEIALEGLDVAVDQVGIRRRLKISRLIVPQWTRADRIRSDHGLLIGFTWKPTNGRPITNGRYWLLDLEKVGS
jgi:hypothetical protein